MTSKEQGLECLRERMMNRTNEDYGERAEKRESKNKRAYTRTRKHACPHAHRHTQNTWRVLLITTFDTLLRGSTTNVLGPLGKQN